MTDSGNRRAGRRQFVLGVSAGALVASSGFLRGAAARSPAVLDGRSFALEIVPGLVDFTGRQRIATTINGGVPGPTLRWREGDEVAVRVSNRLSEPTSIHWHGILLPWNMDGVPGLSFDAIAPDAHYDYRFTLRQSGTYWYHSHSGFQEQTGTYGALIVDPLRPEPFSYDREHVVLLSDWTDEEPMRLFARLKKESHYYNYNRRTLSDIRSDIAERGFAGNRQMRRMWNEMRMTERDIADVTGATYTYLINGQPPAADWTALFGRGERVRLRFVNGSAMTIFDVRIPGLEMTVVAVDGQYVEPVTIDEFRIAVAGTIDVIVAPNADRAYTLFAQSIDRSGFARGTLTPAAGMTADVPGLDPSLRLTMADMGMAMGHTGMSHKPEMTHAAAGNHAAHMSPAPNGADSHAAHAQSRSAADVAVDPKAPRAAVDMRAVAPELRFDDPGVGLRDRSWRVLTHGKLQRLEPSADVREPGREIELHLTGNMMRYMWSMDGVRFADADPIRLSLGEKVRFTLINDTMMHHPIHLHGLWSDVLTGAAGQSARMHTVLVQPGQKVQYDVVADALGPWAYHCHLLYHMDAGMFRVVEVA